MTILSLTGLPTNLTHGSCINVAIKFSLLDDITVKFTRKQSLLKVCDT